MRIVGRVPLVAALALLWCLLWGGFSVMTVVTGVLFAVLLTRVFYLPPVVLSGRFNVWWAVVFVFWLLVDIARASFQVAWKAVAGPKSPRNGIIEVALLTHDDLILTAVAESTSLVPGSLVVEVDRNRGRLFLHVLGADAPGAIERARRAALRTERRILRAIGTSEEVALVANAVARRRGEKAAGRDGGAR